MRVVGEAGREVTGTHMCHHNLLYSSREQWGTIEYLGQAMP